MSDRTCSIDGCSRKRRGREWCNTHYERWRRHGTTADPVARPTACSIDGCDRSPYGHGWCVPHYKRWQRHGDPEFVPARRRPDVDRVRSHVDVRGSDECWPWTGAVDADGYGVTSINGFPRRATRVLYQAEHGSIPDDEVVRHTCDNPPCCNYKRHLITGTQMQNIHDAIERGRWVHGERHPRSKLTTAQVVEVHTLLARGVGMTAIGRRYGVSGTHVRRIRDGVSRKNG